MQKFKTALFGTGFVGRVHLEGIRRLGYVELYAIGEPQIDKANQLAAEFGVARTEADYHRILEDPAVDAVHICTPNALHFPMAKDALLAGKHVICEKPLATSIAAGPGTGRHRQAKRSCATAPRTTCASTRWCSTCAAWWKPATWARSWCCRAPIRRTGCSTIPIGTGASTASSTAPRAAWPISARTGATWRSTSPGSASPASAATWPPSTRPANSPRARSRLSPARRSRRRITSRPPIDTEDMGAVVFRMGNGARGAYTASQVNAGCKNRLQIEIYGTKCGVSWNQERPDELWIGNRNTNNQIIIKDPSLLKPGAKCLRRSPGRPQRRLRRQLQADLPPLLPVDRGPHRHARVPAVRGRPAPVDHSRSRDGKQREARLGGRSAVPGLTVPAWLRSASPKFARRRPRASVRTSPGSCASESRCRTAKQSRPRRPHPALPGGSRSASK